MKETSKSLERRTREGYFTKYFVGKGLDIGCGKDLLPECDPWDLDQGDATLLRGVQNESYDFVYSSHCLEHLDSPTQAISNWWRVLKRNGHLIVTVPDEDLYEQGVWPSRWAGPGHKTTWTIHKHTSWSPVSKNLTSLFFYISAHQVISIRTIDDGYDYQRTESDQTLGHAHAEIEMIIKKL